MSHIINFKTGDMFFFGDMSEKQGHELLNTVVIPFNRDESYFKRTVTGKLFASIEERNKKIYDYLLSNSPESDFGISRWVTFGESTEPSLLATAYVDMRNVIGFIDDIDYSRAFPVVTVYLNEGPTRDEIIQANIKQRLYIYPRIIADTKDGKIKRIVNFHISSYLNPEIGRKE